MTGCRKHFIALLASLVCSIAVAAAQPRINVSETRFAYGDMYQGERPNHVITIRNDGSSPLLIENVDSPCNCTSTQLHHSIIPPNDSSVLVITFNSEDFVDSVSRFVVIVSNDLAHRNVFVNYTANVRTLLLVLPPRVFFGELTLNKPALQQLTVRNTGKTSVRIKSISASVPGVTISVDRKTLAPGESTTLRLSLTAREEKPIAGQVIIATDKMIQPFVRFRFSAQGGAERH